MSGTIFLQEDVNAPLSLDGVNYALLEHGGELWRMGAVDPAWRQTLPFGVPTQEELASLAGRGVWLARQAQQRPRLAVMCCGQGSVWPGMGRELYDAFPAARAAMDEVASFANWDVLSLMDEKDPGVIGLTRWQQPYLFLLEYAQWSVLRSLGLEPDLVCGHSLGELIALCLAGVYSVGECWYILDTRSRHMASIEANAPSDTGMLALYANEQVLSEAMSRWPELYISNYNTPDQFILSGPKQVLVEARRAFRKERHPAVMLNVTLAFHHPSMRVLRDLSYRRLNFLTMSAPSIPMLSCVTTGFYPGERSEISRYIVDLDENSVRWVECVRNMRSRDRIDDFIEVGPQDTLCGLVQATAQDACCMPSAVKGKELEAMRRTLARLYARGHLSHARVRSCLLERKEQQPASPKAESSLSPAPASEPRSHADSAVASFIVGLLAKACGRDAASISMQMDLRFDLGLRSISFPSLLEEAEKELGVGISFESLLEVSTVGDFVRLCSKDKEAGQDAESAGVDLGALIGRPWRVRVVSQEGEAVESPLNPSVRLCDVGEDTVFLLLGEAKSFAEGLFDAVSPLGARFVLACGAAPLKDAIVEAGGRILAVDANPGFFLQVLSVLPHADVAVLDGLMAEKLQEGEGEELLQGLLKAGCRTLAFFRQGACGPLSFADSARRAGLRALDIACEDGGDAEETGDLFARELVCGRDPFVRWVSKDRAKSAPQPFLDDADAFPWVFPEKTSSSVRSPRIFRAEAQFSGAGEPALGEYFVSSQGRELPESFLILAKMEACRIFLPWLDVVGLSDLHFYSTVHSSRGCTREAKVVTDVRPWLPEGEAMVRMCRSRVQMRSLLENGRRTAGYSRVSDSLVFMSKKPVSQRPLWRDGLGGEPVRCDVSAWYDKNGAGSAWRLLDDVRVYPGRGLEASLSLDSFVALRPNWQYHCELSAVEGVLQAARMAFDFDPPATAGPFHLNMVGFIGAWPDAHCGPCKLELRRVWDKSPVVTYDAQVTDARGRCLLCANHMEFYGSPSGPAE